MSESTGRTKYKTDLDFVDLLTLLFIALKLTGEITWSWWWVLAPIWISAVCIFATKISEERKGKKETE